MHLLVAALALSSQVMQAELVCSYEPGNNAVFLQDYSVVGLAPQLLGVMFYDNAIYYYNDLEDAVNLYDCGDERVVKFGSIGSGPEDHLGRCEPLDWPGRGAVMINFALPSKVIEYDKYGKFVSSFLFPFRYQILQAYESEGRVFCCYLDSQIDGNRRMDLRVYAAALDPDGAILNDVMIRQKVLDSAVDSEADLQILPRMAAAGSRLYIQPDIYTGEISCYDENLVKMWTYVWKPEMHKNEFAGQKTKEGLAAAEYLPVVRGLWAREGGELWIEDEDGKRNEGRMDLKSISAMGVENSRISIVGLPKIPGDYSFKGRYILWSNVNYDDVDNASIRIYTLDEIGR